MKDIMGLMKQAKEMQSKMQEMQEGMSEIEAEGSAGAGMVKVTLSGKFDLRSINIDPSMVSEGEAEIIEDLIIAAHADAKDKVERMVQEKTQELTSGLQLPPGMKLPF
ncbi:MAG: YbaB/EbfC family nucleoid-associated protein [Nitratireductor sp.]